MLRIDVFQEDHVYLRQVLPVINELIAERWVTLEDGRKIILEAVEAKRGPRSNLKGWLISTAAHAVSDHLRRRYRRPVEPITDTIPEPGPGVQDAYDQREQLQTVRQAYSQLTSVQQNVLALRFGQGYNLEETAAILQKNTNAIKALQFRALTALQREIGEVSHEEY